jgi:hypothetical protein
VASTGPVTFRAPSSGTYYFGCSLSDHCSGGGMKVAITVTNTIASGYAVANGQ